MVLCWCVEDDNDELCIHHHCFPPSLILMLLHNCIKEYDNVNSKCLVYHLLIIMWPWGNGNFGVGFEVNSKLPCERNVNEEVLQVEIKVQQ